VLFAALFAAWLVAVLLETRDLGDVHHGVNADVPKAPHLWHSELEVPQPVLTPPPPEPLPSFVNNSAAGAAEHWAEQERRNGLFTIEVARKNPRNAALLTVLGARQRSEPAPSAWAPAGLLQPDPHGDRRNRAILAAPTKHQVVYSDEIGAS